MGMMSFEFTDAEEGYIKHRSKRLGMSYSDYLRYAAIYEGVMGLDVEALRLARRRNLAKVRAAFGDLLAEGEAHPA